MPVEYEQKIEDGKRESDVELFITSCVSLHLGKYPHRSGLGLDRRHFSHIQVPDMTSRAGINLYFRELVNEKQSCVSQRVGKRHARTLTLPT